MPSSSSNCLLLVRPTESPILGLNPPSDDTVASIMRSELCLGRSREMHLIRADQFFDRQPPSCSRYPHLGDGCQQAVLDKIATKAECGVTREDKNRGATDPQTPCHRIPQQNLEHRRNRNRQRQ